MIKALQDSVDVLFDHLAKGWYVYGKSLCTIAPRLMHRANVRQVSTRALVEVQIREQRRSCNSRRH